MSSDGTGIEAEPLLLPRLAWPDPWKCAVATSALGGAFALRKCVQRPEFSHSRVAGCVAITSYVPCVCVCVPRFTVVTARVF